jgi:hypothetical protein
MTITAAAAAAAALLLPLPLPLTLPLLLPLSLPPLRCGCRWLQLRAAAEAALKLTCRLI